MVPAVAIGLGLGLVVGAINGVGVALLGVQPLVMTLGTGLMTQGVIIVYSQRILASRSIVPDFIHAIGSDRLGGLIPLDLFLWLPIAALVVVTLGQTGFGRLLYAIGDNREACRLAGVRVWRSAPHRLHNMRCLRGARGICPRRPYQFRRWQPGRHLPLAFHRRGHHWRHFDIRRPRGLFWQYHRRADPDGARGPVDFSSTRPTDQAGPLRRYHPVACGGVRAADRKLKRRMTATSRNASVSASSSSASRPCQIWSLRNIHRLQISLAS